MVSCYYKPIASTKEGCGFGKKGFLGSELTIKIESWWVLGIGMKKKNAKELES